MPGAIAKPSKSTGPDPREDAFLRFINRVVDWTRGHVGLVVGAGVAVALLVGGGIYYLSYSQNLEERAASELQSLRAALATGTDTVGIEQLRSYVEQFSGTEAALHGSVMLARQQLDRGDASEAVSTVRSVVDETTVETPLGYAARMLLGHAREAAGQQEAALGTFGQLASNARFGFQRRDAAAERARILVQAGRLSEAEDVYRRLTEETADGQAQQLHAVRLGEVRAMLSSSSSSSSGSDGDASTPSGAESPPASGESSGSAEGEGAAG